MGDHSTGIFYAESWALIHYLMQAGKAAELGQFINLLARGTPAEKAFTDAFQLSYVQMEKNLRKYVDQNSYEYREITLSGKMVFEADMQVSPLPEAASNAYLGDLLYHTNREDDAEPYLVAALKLQPDSGMANIALGMVRLKQRKFAEARAILEKAIAGDPKNHLVFYRYAYLLSREAGDEYGFVSSFGKDDAAKMRDALRKAIALNPSFTESYELLAYVNLVTGEQLDESVTALRTALKYQPGNQRYALRMAEILIRQDKLTGAAAIAEKIAATSDDPETKNRADRVITSINQTKAYNDRRAADRKRFESQSQGGQVVTDDVVADDPDAVVRSINEALRKTGTDEVRVVGIVQKIDCSSHPYIYTIKTPDETFTLATRDFSSLDLRAYTPDADNLQVGCGASLAALNAVITYKAVSPARPKSRGDVVSIEFVPKNFRFMAAEAPPRLARRSSTGNETTTVVTQGGPPPPARSGDMETERRAAMMRSVNENLTKPGQGQKRDMGYLDKIECSSKGMFFIVRTTGKTYRLFAVSPQSLKITLYTPDLANMEFGCSLKPVEVPAVFVYTVKPDSKLKTDGEIVSLEFVPKSFVLDQ